MNFWPDFIKLKTSLSGNRELTEFEFTFGMPKEELFHITPMNKYQTRIISELEFALRLHEKLNGKFEKEVREALYFLLSEVEKEGTVSKSAAEKAENMLLPLSAAAKEYKLILVGHAHIDMNWMWSYQETVAITLSTFRTVLNLMKQYPTFCFAQSQASVYQIVEEYDPDMMEEIKERIKEGRWEVTASAWVETDKNMPSTESLLRHIRYTRDYLKNHWGLDEEQLDIDFSPDTFGHSANIPEIDTFGHVKYMYHCRALDDDVSLYRWKAPSGKEILVYREQYWYNSAIVPRIGQSIFEISKRCGDFKTGLIVYGVGDHGGGPTRKDVETALDMAEWPVYPAVKMGTFHEFFHEAEQVREKLPVIDHELNYFSTGCYTTQSRIKKGNRKSEATLYDTEALTSFARTTANRSFNNDRHEAAWQKVLYTHFHDILTGSCVQDSREHAMGLFSNAMAYAQTEFSKSAAALAAQMDTSSIETDTNIALTQAEGAGGGFNMSSNTGMPVPAGFAHNIGFNNGVPNPERGSGKVRIFNIFNTLPYARKAVTELTVWDWVGDLRRVEMVDTKGNPVPFQKTDNQLELFWDHRFFRVMVECEVPALGYTTVILREKAAQTYETYRHPVQRSEYSYDDYILENDFIRARFDRISGCLVSLIDKEQKKEYIHPHHPASLNVITMQGERSDAWRLGKYLKKEALTAPVDITPLQQGNLRQSFSASYKWGLSKMTVTPVLYKNEKALRFCISADWNEIKTETVPLLTFCVPLSFKTEKFLCDVPAGAQYRSPMTMDMPALSYCAAIDEDKTALALMPDSKYGYRAEEDALSVTLINTAGYPDPYPDRGQHTVNIALTLGEDSPKKLKDTAMNFNHPMYFMSNNAHPGTLPMELSYLDFDSDSAVLSSVLPTEDKNTVHVRFYETEGEKAAVTLTFAKDVSRAVSVDLAGKELLSDVRANKNKVTVSVSPYAIGEVKITF